MLPAFQLPERRSTEKAYRQIRNHCRDAFRSVAAKELDKAVTKAAEKQQQEKAEAKSEKIPPADLKAAEESKAQADTTHANLAALEAEKANSNEALTKSDKKEVVTPEVVAPRSGNTRSSGTRSGGTRSGGTRSEEIHRGLTTIIPNKKHSANTPTASTISLIRLRKVANALSAARDEESAPAEDSTENKDEVTAAAPVVAEEEVAEIKQDEPAEVNAEFAPTTAKESEEEEEERLSAEKAKAESEKAKAEAEEPKSAAKESRSGDEPKSILDSIMAGDFEPVIEAESDSHDEPDLAAASTPSTLDKFAEIIGEVSSNTEKKIEEPASSLKLNFQSSSDKVEREESKREDEARVEASTTNGESQTSNGAKGMSIIKEAGSSTVPEWCKKYFSSELNSLSKELTELNEQVRLAQQKIKEVESRVALTKGLRNTLLTSSRRKNSLKLAVRF